MKTKLTGFQTELLLGMVGIGYDIVDRDNFVDLAKLVAAGMATPYEDSDCMACAITDKGKNYALKHKLVRPDKDAYKHEYSRTAKGERYRKKYHCLMMA